VVNCVRLDLLHWWDHLISNFKSFHEDYYRLHRKWCSVSTSPDWQTMHTRSSHRLNKRWTFISPLPGPEYFTKCLPVIILYKAQLNAIIVNRKYTLLGRLVNFNWCWKLEMYLKVHNLLINIKILQLYKYYIIQNKLNVHSLWKCTNFHKGEQKHRTCNTFCPASKSCLFSDY
jgi:hypothetical protein